MSTETKNMVIQSIVANDYPIRNETHQGREHIVVPVVMMVEGVHSGSRGPLYHSAYELGRVVGAWNGIPITIQHPQEGENYISANSPKQIDRAVGRVYNAHMEGDKLKAEAWIDLNKIQEVSSIALAYIQDQRPLDVSVGVFTDEEDEEGEWNGEIYTGIAHNHRPDHLALLPGGRGACSWEDGCGVRVNNAKTKAHEMSKEVDLKVYKKDLTEKGLTIIPVLNQSGYMEILNKVSQKLDSMDSDLRIYFLEELYEDKVIYRVRNRESDTTTLYQQSYSIGDDGKVEFTGDPAEVRKNITYQTMSDGGMKRTKFNNNKSRKMDKNVQAKVDQLIANTESKFTNCDREWLESLSMNQLNELFPKEKKEEKPEQLDVNSAIAFLKENAPKEEDLLSLFSKETREAHEMGLKLYKEKKEEMVKHILDNSDAWKEDELKDMDFSLLEKVSKSVKGVVDYSGQGAGGSDENLNNNSKNKDDEPLMRIS